MALENNPMQATARGQWVALELFGHRACLDGRYPSRDEATKAAAAWQAHLDTEWGTVRMAHAAVMAEYREELGKLGVDIETLELALRNQLRRTLEEAGIATNDANG